MCSLAMCNILILCLFITQINCQYRDGDIRLVGGSYQWEGRVEIYFSATWGTITDSQWTSNDAQAVCRKMGYFKPGAIQQTGGYFGEGSGPIHFDNVVCSGREYNLTDCQLKIGTRQSTHTEDVGVKCQTIDSSYREGSIRLAGGAYNWEGRVEIYWMGEWGAVSSGHMPWTATEAEVVCRQLGHSNNDCESSACANQEFITGLVSVPHCCGYYGEGYGTIQIHSIACNGYEANITSCNYNASILYDHQNDVGVQCTRGDDYREGEIRLVGGSYSWEGRVEIYLYGEWGTITGSRASSLDAHVVCRQLGYDTRYGIYTDKSRCCARHGVGTGPIHMNYLACSGTEFKLVECNYSNSTSRHSSDWGVTCRNDGPKSGQVRLYRTDYLPSDYLGLVEVYISDEWGTVTGSWTPQNAEVVCSQLGFVIPSYRISLPSYYSTYNRQPAPVHMSDVQCLGNESRLTECPHSTREINGTLATQSCQTEKCKIGDIRLAGGETELEGRVEVCTSHYIWGTLCNHQWTMAHTEVVCRQLGYSDSGGSYYAAPYSLDFDTRIQIDYVSCSGSEQRLWDCPHFSHSYGDCTHSDDAGVRCKPAQCNHSEVRILTENSNLKGQVLVCYNKRWAAVCDDIWWDDDAASVVCKQLGYFSGAEYSPSIWKKYSLKLTDVHCSGTESALTDCSLQEDTECSRDKGGVSCHPADCGGGEVRLEAGETEWEGRLEVCYSGRWGTVSSEGWTQVNTQVICNDLGYDITGAPNSAIPQSLSKPVFLQNVTCRSTALTITECEGTRLSGERDNVTEVTVRCQQPLCSDGDLKLVGGGRASEGRLEMCFDKRWTAIDGDGWTLPDTQVACTQLGYRKSDIPHDTIVRSSKALPVLLSHFGCNGTEERLLDCPHKNYSGIASASKDVRVSCIKEESPDTPVTPNTTSCEDCESDYTENISSSSTTTEVVVASLAIAVLCFLVVIGLVLRYFIRGFKQKEKQSGRGKRDTTDDSTSTLSDKSTIVNVSYIPNTRSSLDGQPMDYEIPFDNNESQPSCRQPLPPIPLTQLPIKQAGEHDHIGPVHIYDTCK